MDFSIPMPTMVVDTQNFRFYSEIKVQMILLDHISLHVKDHLCITKIRKNPC